MSQQVCGGWKTSIVAHVDQEAGRETSRARPGNLRQLRGQAPSSARRIDWDAQFTQFQGNDALLPQLPAADAPTLDLSTPQSNVMNGYGQHRIPQTSRGWSNPSAALAEANGRTPERWADQFQRQHPAYHPHSISAHYSAPIQATPTRVTPWLPVQHPMSMHPAPSSSVANNGNAQAEFDEALKGWLSTASTDEPTLRASDSASVQAPSVALAPEANEASSATTQAASMEEQTTARAEQERNREDTQLAVAAQEIINSVSEDRSDKFQQSEFLGLMRRIASMDLVVRDNALVSADTATAAPENQSSSSGSGTANAGHLSPKRAAMEEDK